MDPRRERRAGSDVIPPINASKILISNLPLRWRGGAVVGNAANTKAGTGPNRGRIRLRGIQIYAFG